MYFLGGHFIILKLQIIKNKVLRQTFVLTLIICLYSRHQFYSLKLIEDNFGNIERLFIFSDTNLLTWNEKCRIVLT